MTYSHGEDAALERQNNDSGPCDCGAVSFKEAKFCLGRMAIIEKILE
jgi:hypothetical protein